jgi:hypothetical protein
MNIIVILVFKKRKNVRWLDCLCITIVGSNLPPQYTRLGRSVLTHTSAKSYSAQPQLNFAQSCIATAHALLRVTQGCSLLGSGCLRLLMLDSLRVPCPDSSPDSGPDFSPDSGPPNFFLIISQHQQL